MSRVLVDERLTAESYLPAGSNAKAYRNLQVTRSVSRVVAICRYEREVIAVRTFDASASLAEVMEWSVNPRMLTPAPFSGHIFEVTISPDLTDVQTETKEVA